MGDGSSTVRETVCGLARRTPLGVRAGVQLFTYLRVPSPREQIAVFRLRLNPAALETPAVRLNRRVAQREREPKGAFCRCDVGFRAPRSAQVTVGDAPTHEILGQRFKPRLRRHCARLPQGIATAVWAILVIPLGPLQDK